MGYFVKVKYKIQDIYDQYIGFYKKPPFGESNETQEGKNIET